MKVKTVTFIIKLILLFLSSIHDFLTDDPPEDKKPADNDVKPPT